MGPDDLLDYGVTTELDVCTLDMSILGRSPIYIVFNPSTTVWRLDAGIEPLAAAVTNSPQTRALASTIPALTKPNYLLGPGDQVKITSGFQSSQWTADVDLTIGWYGVDLAAQTIAEEAVELGIVTTTEALFAKSAWRTALKKCAVGVYAAIPTDGIDATDPAVTAFFDGAGNAISGGICASELLEAHKTVRALPPSWASDVPIALEKMGSRTGAVENAVEAVARAFAAFR